MEWSIAPILCRTWRLSGMASFKASHVGCHIVPYRCGIVYGMIWRLTGVASCWALHGVTRPRLWCSIRSEMASHLALLQRHIGHLAAVASCIACCDGIWRRAWCRYGVVYGISMVWSRVWHEMALYVVSKQYVVVYAVESGWNVASLSDGVVYSVSIEMSSYMASMWRSTWRLTVRRGVWRHME